MLGLRRWISAESGATLPKMSIGGMVRSREMGKRRKQLGHHRISTSNRCGTFTVTEKANLANRFLDFFNFIQNNH